MSKAFTKESDQDGVTDLPERSVSDYPNLVTPEGLALIDAEIDRLSRSQSEAVASADKDAQARHARDLRYWTARRNSAVVTQPPTDTETVRFGARVSIERDDGRRQAWRIVGEDEADPARGTLSHASPLARALMGRSVGDVVQAGPSEAEITAIDV